MSSTTTYERSGYLLVLAAAVLWGTTGTAQSLAPDGATPAVIGALRLLVGSIGLLIFAQLRGVLRLPIRQELPALLIGGLAVAAYQICFFGGVSLTGVAIGIGSAPILAGILDWLVAHQSLSQRWLVATTLAIIGCVLLTLPNSAGELTVHPLGIALAVGAGASYAIYALAGKYLLRTMPPETMVALEFSTGMLFLIPLLFTGDVGWALQPAGLLVVIHLGLITVTLSYILFGRGLMTVPASTAVTLSLAEPLTAGLLGVLVVGERLTPLALVGIALMLVGLWWLTAKK
jgi:DME family drug/metabolite transporter